MIAQHSQLVPGIVSAILAILYWGLLFWRTFRRNRGNLVIECGIVTIMIFLAMAFLSRIINFPDWAFGSLLATVFLLCLITLFFFFLEIFRSLRKRLTRRRKAAES